MRTLHLRPSPLSLREMLDRSLSNWDKSIEELPWYMVGQFGLEATLAGFEEFESREELTDTEKDKLDTMRYWLRVQEG